MCSYLFVYKYNEGTAPGASSPSNDAASSPGKFFKSYAFSYLHYF